MRAYERESPNRSPGECSRLLANIVTYAEWTICSRSLEIIGAITIVLLVP